MINKKASEVFNRWPLVSADCCNGRWESHLCVALILHCEGKFKKKFALVPNKSFGSKRIFRNLTNFPEKGDSASRHHPLT
jgi:hypothetical protein